MQSRNGVASPTLRKTAITIQAARAWLSVGYLLAKESPEDSISAYGRAIRLKPGYAEAYYNQGVSKGELGRHDDAITDYDEAIRLKPDFAEAYSNRGHSKETLGQHDDAIADCNEAIRLKTKPRRSLHQPGRLEGQPGATR